jgi:hypothetical protein
VLPTLFLSTLETTIVSTSLVSITNALDGFELRDWIVTAYLISYTGTLPSNSLDCKDWVLICRIPHNLRKIQRRVWKENNADFCAGDIYAFLNIMWGCEWDC